MEPQPFSLPIKKGSAYHGYYLYTEVVESSLSTKMDAKMYIWQPPTEKSFIIKVGEDFYWVMEK
jgi:hypothetical protein